MSALHPFPWHWEEHELSEGYSCIVYDAEGRSIRSDYLDRDTAALIAAAEEMHAALLASMPIVQALRDYDLSAVGRETCDAAIARIEAAIAQAEGRS